MTKQTMNCPRCGSTLEVEETEAGELRWDCDKCNLTVTQHMASTV